MSGLFRQSFNDTSNAQETEILGGTDQTRIGNVSDSLKVAIQNSVVITAETEPATFAINLLDTATANNKSMLSIVNTTGSTVVVRIREIRVVNTQNTAVTGTVTDFNLYRCTSHSGGTSVTPQTYDTADSLNASVTVRTGATITGEVAAALRHWDMSNDEWGPGANDVESFEHTLAMLIPSITALNKTKAITLRANEGLTLKCTTNTAVGLFDIVIIFTQE